MITQQQLIQLVSGTPDNVVYHILTLLLIQAALGIAVAQWRRDPGNQLSRRLAVAAGAFLVTRLVFFAAILISGGDNVDALRTLPPVEQALNTMVALFLVWSLAPRPTSVPRLNNVLLAAATLVVAVMYIFFAQSWAVADPERFYSTSAQARTWSVMQIAFLGVGLLWIGWRGRQRSESVLRLLTVGVLLAAHAAHYLNRPVLSPTETEIPYWIRLGHLVVFPLFAIITYRHTIRSLLAEDRALAFDAGDATAAVLERATRVASASDLERTIDNALLLTQDFLPASFLAVGILPNNGADDLQVRSLQAEEAAPGATRPQWMLNLSDWPALRLALKQRQSVHLSHNGLGARQLRDLYQELNVANGGPLLIEPLLTNQQDIGVLFLVADGVVDHWSDVHMALAPPIAAYVAQTVANARAHESLHGARIDDPSDTSTLGRLLIAEKERDAARARIETLNHLLERAEARAHAEEAHAAELERTLNNAKVSTPPPWTGEGQPSRQGSVQELEQEIHTLRESLIHAEEALAIAAAGEQGLSADWVMRALTRYSAELEQAQGEIQQLERQLQTYSSSGQNQMLRDLMDRLRTPMTSITGYTDLLLGESMGALSVNQRKFLQRVHNNVIRMRSVIGELGAFLAMDRPVENAEEENMTHDVAEVVDIAIDTILLQLSERELRLELDVEEGLPPVPLARESLHQIITHLLNNACHVSTRRNRIGLTVQADTIEEDAGDNPLRFLQVTVRDYSVGVQPKMVPHIFDQDSQVETPFVPGLLRAHDLVLRSGGRMWVESSLGQGNIFSVLLPVENSGTGNVSREHAVNGHRA